MGDARAERALVLASDHAGYALKRELAAALRDSGWDVEDLGTHDAQSCDYPDFAHALAGAIEEGRHSVGLLVCGTGTGMAIAANRHKHIRAAVCTDPYAARMSREHNDANVLCLGSRVIGGGLALATAEAFLAAEFEGGRHARRVGKLDPA